MKGFCLERCYKLFGVRGVWCKKCWVYKLFGVKLFWLSYCLHKHGYIRLPSHTQGAYKDQSPRRFWSRRAALWRRRLSALAFFRPLTGTGGQPVKPISWEALGRSAGSSAHAAITYHGAAPGGYRFLRTAPRLYT